MLTRSSSYDSISVFHSNYVSISCTVAETLPPAYKLKADDFQLDLTLILQSINQSINQFIQHRGTMFLMR